MRTTGFLEMLEVEAELERYPGCDDVTIVERGRGLILRGYWVGAQLTEMRLIRWKSGQWSLSMPTGRGRWARLGYFCSVRELFRVLLEDPTWFLLRLIL